MAVLQETLEQHQLFMARVEPDFVKCRESINESVQTFERLTSAGRKNLWSEFFNGLSERADEIVAENFGDNDLIASKMKKTFQNRQEKIKGRLQALLDEHLKVLQESLGKAIERLVQDIRRVEFQQRISVDAEGQKARYHASNLDMELSLKEWGSVAFNVGSYALTGATIGSAFPIIGTAIGAVTGAVIGALVSVMQLFTGKEKRIRKAQSQVQDKIDEIRDQVMNSLPEEDQRLMNSIRQEVKNMTLQQVDSVRKSLAEPLEIFSQQIALMHKIKTQLEQMPHGTVQSIQC